MSTQIKPETIAGIYVAVLDERVDDWTLVSGWVEASGRVEYPDDEGLPTDDPEFEQHLAEERRVQAFDRYTYPVAGTGPTLESSLHIVRDILTVRRLEASREDRAAGIRKMGADPALLNAEGREHFHRLREKGILRIFDQRTNRAMWAVDFDALASKRAAVAE